jgi:hypothetical protein
MKSLWVEAGKLELHGYDAFESQRISELDGHPAFTHVLHPGREGLPKSIVKPHRHIHVVSEIPTMFAFHLGNGALEDAA